MSKPYFMRATCARPHDASAILAANLNAPHPLSQMDEACNAHTGNWHKAPRCPDTVAKTG